MNYQQLVNDITKTILTNIKEVIKKGLDYTRGCKAQVIELIGDDKAKVKYNGETHTIYSSVYCDVGDMVNICIPNNEWKNAYVVENRTLGKRQKDYSNRTASLEKNFCDKNANNLNANFKVYMSSGNTESNKVTILVPKYNYTPFSGFICTRYFEPESFLIVTGGEGSIYSYKIKTGEAITSVTKKDDNTLELVLSYGWSMFSLMYFTQNDAELKVIRG